MCLTIIDPATGWFEMVELPIIIKKVTKKGKTTEEVVIDKSSAEVARLFNRQWLSRYPREIILPTIMEVNSNFTSKGYASPSTLSTVQPK